MKLRGIDFGRVMNASGARGFFGEGYWFHPLVPGLGYKGAIFVAKTTTAWPQKGNMPLGRDGVTPRDFFPDCIKVNFFTASTLNAVGLSGPGIRHLLASGKWQRRQGPFFISFMAVGPSHEERAPEVAEFLLVLGTCLPEFQAPVGLQINFTCPNVKLDVTSSQTMISEIEETLDAASRLDIPLVVKLNVLFPPEAAQIISTHPACDAICMGNTIPWGQLKKINWPAIFNTRESPLKKYGDGGLGGTILFPIVRNWIRSALHAGVQKPLIHCGGILSKADALAALSAGADAIELGSVSLLAPWRVQGIINRVNRITEIR